jgi:hypothetical protein
MAMPTQLLIIMGFQLAGEALVSGCGLSFPGPLCGLLLLLAWLNYTGGPSAELSRAADILVDHLGLLFVPVQRHARVWMRATKGADPRRQYPECCDHRRHDAQMVTPEGADVARDVDDLIDGCQRLLCLAIECPSLRSWLKPPSLPDEKRGSEFGLEVADAPADRGLRRMQPLSRLSDDAASNTARKACSRFRFTAVAP